MRFGKKGMEPSDETPAEYYGEESSMRGKKMDHKRSKRHSKRHLKRHGRRKGGR
jgi:hypothetical protein